MRGYCGVLCLLASIVSGIAEGADYYVSLTGSDGGDGSVARPWRTLQQAADSVTAGDRVTVRSGEYTGFQLTTSGTAQQPIQFLADSGVRIVQPNPGTGRDGINLEVVSHVSIEGFEVIGMPRAGIRVVGTENQFSQGVTVRNNRADQNGRWGIFSGFAHDMLVENNETSRSATEHGIYLSNSGDRPIVRDNLVWGNHASGI